MTTALRSLSAVALLLLLGGAALSQGTPCFLGDDGFDTGCCAGVTPTLPTFPALTMQASWGELRGCAPTNLNVGTVALSPPTMVFCDYALIGIGVTFPGGETINGMLVAKYARTWIQLPAPTGQIWRFLVNGDLTCLPNAAATPCTTFLPKCAFVSPGFPVHFDGHIDYHCNQTTAGGVFTASLSLTHHQGCISHPFWSCSPLTGLLSHPESSWHLVGPAPFVFGPAPSPLGPLVADAVRPSFLRLVPSFVYACQSEEKVGPPGFSMLVPGAPGGCLCAVTNGCNGNAIPCPAAIMCYEHQVLTFFDCCPTGVVAGPHGSFPVGVPPFNVTGLVALKLGTWGPLPQYPSGSSLTAYAGVLSYSNVPAGCAPPNWPFHFAVGVATQNSSTLALPFTQIAACGPPAPPSTAFVDLCNVLPLGNPGLTPGYGCASASDVVWSFNTP
jgi:hypothetical protein